MNAQELQTLLRSAQPPALLHVLPPEIFAARRIPGSRNACVYETAFLDHVQALALDPAAPLVVYGAGGHSLDAVTAAEKLRAAGYTDVRVFEGGLEEWCGPAAPDEALASAEPGHTSTPVFPAGEGQGPAGRPFEGTGQIPVPAVPDGHYRVDPAQSVIRWTGRNLFNHHSGTVRLAGGEIHARQGSLVSARFTIDMATIACEDLGDSALNAMLLAHLRTADFFDAEHHPTAEFAATAAERIPSCTDGTPNYLLRGDFTLRGITRPLEFPVLIATKNDAQHLTGQGLLEFDRTAHGSQYGSGKLFRFLGQHVVNDIVHLHVKVHAERNESMK